MSLLQKALNAIIDKAKNETEKGNAFESLSKIFLEKDDTQVQQYNEIFCINIGEYFIVLISPSI